MCGPNKAPSLSCVGEDVDDELVELVVGVRFVNRLFVLFKNSEKFFFSLHVAGWGWIIA